MHKLFPLVPKLNRILFLSQSSGSGSSRRNFFPVKIERKSNLDQSPFQFFEQSFAALFLLLFYLEECCVFHLLLLVCLSRFFSLLLLFLLPRKDRERCVTKIAFEGRKTGSTVIQFMRLRKRVSLPLLLDPLFPSP